MRNEKKLVSFANKTIINNYLDDVVSTATNVSCHSDVIENILMATIMPQKQELRYVVQKFLYNTDHCDDSESVNNVKETLYALLNNSNYNIELLPIVQYICDTVILSPDADITENKKNYEMCCMYIDECVKFLKNNTEDRECEVKLYESESIQLKETPEQVKLFTYLVMILASWDVTKNYKNVYKLLSCLVLASNIENSARNRLELLKSLRKI